MLIETIVSGALQSNCFVVGCTEENKAIVIDPGDDVERIVQVLGDNDMEPIAAVVTHGHFDHIEGNARLVDHYPGLPVWCHPEDAAMLTSSMYNMSSLFTKAIKSPPAGKHLNEGDVVEVGQLRFEVLHVPGHSPGSICLHEPNHKVVFVGDVLFADGIGRTDFPGGNHARLIESIHAKLLVLPDDTTVYAGHGQSTTIGHERGANPFL